MFKYIWIYELCKRENKWKELYEEQKVENQRYAEQNQKLMERIEKINEYLSVSE